MDEQAKLAENMRRRKWIANNGKVLRAINMLRTKYIALEQLRYALEPNVTLSELADSINYLSEIDYISLRNIDSKAETTLADAEFGELEAKLNENGIRFLAGKITDDCVGR